MVTYQRGTRYRTRIQDREEDEEYGEVTHPIGSTFLIGEPLHTERCDARGNGAHGSEGHVCGQMYAVLWEQAVDASGQPVPADGCVGMWTIWSADEIARDAERVGQ
jgi:hypothetical protein